jgi:hypothetical protein
LFIVSASPVLLRAQFQAPTSEELKMTADPQAPGAAAVYFNFEEIANDPMHFQSFYARIKVLTEKGKELATVEVPYMRGVNTISDIKARTIHADGTVIPLEGKPEDLMIAKSGDRQMGRKVFTLPSVEVGSILEYRYELRYDDNHFSSPTWEIQRPYFVHKAHYAFTPFQAFQPGNQKSTGRYLLDTDGSAVNTLIWWVNLPKGVSLKTDSGVSYSLDMTEIPPIPDEDWMPPVESVLSKVRFYYKHDGDAKEFWISAAKRWSKEADHFAEPSSTIHEAVSGLVAPGDSDLGKAKKLYAAVEALDNTDYTRRKGESELKQLKLKEAKRAENTWTQKSGSSEDIALLYLAMLRAAGLTAYPAKVVARNRGSFDLSYMDTGQLDDTVIILSIGGKEIFLDPGEKMCPFETMNWKHSNAQGLRESAEGVGVVTTPLQFYTENTTARIGDVTLDAQGGITGSLRFVMSGQEAMRWRQAALRNDEPEVKKQFDHELESIIPEGVEAHIDHFLALEQPGANLIAFVNVKGSLGTATAKRLLLPGFFFQTRGSRSFVNKEKRLMSVDMHYSESVNDQVTYHLPAGMTVEGAPTDTKISWPVHAAYVAKTIQSPGQVIIGRGFARGFTLAKPEEYQDLRGFYQKIAAVDEEQLVLTAASAARGN